MFTIEDENSKFKLLSLIQIEVIYHLSNEMYVCIHTHTRSIYIQTIIRLKNC